MSRARARADARRDPARRASTLPPERPDAVEGVGDRAVRGPRPRASDGPARADDTPRDAAAPRRRAHRDRAALGPPAIDRAAAERAIAEFLRALGVDVADPHLATTPARVVSAWTDVLIEGYARDPLGALGETFPAPSRGAVVVRDIPILSMCPHHLLPLTGTAHLAFYPRDRVPGFGRLASFVDALAHRLVLQEALTASIADTLSRAIGAEATAVVVEARHLCVAVTDPARQGAVFRTSATRGPRGRAEALLRQIDARAETP